MRGGVEESTGREIKTNLHIGTDPADLKGVVRRHLLLCDLVPSNGFRAQS